MENEPESTSTPKPFWPPTATPAPSADAGSPSAPPPPPPETANVDSTAQPTGSATPGGKPEDFRERVKPVVEGAKTAAVTAAKMAEQGARKAWPIIEPLLKKAWLNLRVWLPQLANPDFRSRQVVYDSDEFLADGMWMIDLPRQCWKTGQTDGLNQRSVELDLRSSENPLQIVVATAGATFLFLLLWWYEWAGLYMVLFCALIGYGILWLKSWAEQVRITYYCAPEVTEDMPAPEVAGFDGKLYVIMADTKLAEAGRMSIAARRKARAAGPVSQMVASAGAPMSPAAPAAAPPPPTNTGYRREELPPLKLDE